MTSEQGSENSAKWLYKALDRMNMAELTDEGMNRTTILTTHRRAADTGGAMSVGMSLQLTPIHVLILETIERRGPLLLDELANEVARASRSDVDEVVAAIWDLVQERRLAYGADARVTIGP